MSRRTRISGAPSLPRIVDAAARADETHILMKLLLANCDGVNARQLAKLLEDPTIAARGTWRVVTFGCTTFSSALDRRPSRPFETQAPGASFGAGAILTAIG